MGAANQAGRANPEQREQRQRLMVLALSTIAFIVCFAAWMMYGVLITFLVESATFSWSTGEMGVLIGPRSSPAP